MRTLFVFLVLIAAASAQVRLVEVTPANAAQESALRALHLDDVCCHGSHVIVHDDAEMAALVATGIPHVILEDDLKRHYASRLTSPITPFGAGSTPAFGQGSMGGYYTLAEMVAFLDDLVAQYPNVIAPKQSIGTTIEGRDLWAWKISDNPTIDETEPEVLIDALHHAREPMSMHSILWMARELCQGYGSDADYTALVDEREIWIVPMVNPDGYVHNQTTDPNGGGLWRKNRRNNGDGTFGVDLNRNYGFAWGIDNSGSSPNTSSETYRGTGPFSEPETLALKTFAESRNFSSGMSNHSYSQLVFIPPGHQPNQYPPQPLRARYESYAAKMSTFGEGYIGGYPWDILYSANGTTQDWWYGNLYGGQSMWAFGSEIGNSSDGFWPPSSRIVPLASSTLELLLHVVRIAGPSLEITSQTLTEVGGVVAGAWEPGETLAVTALVANEGTIAGTAQLRIETSSPHLTVVNGTASLGSIAPFGGTADNLANPLTVLVSSVAPVGAFVAFDVVAEAAGAAALRTSYRMPVGLSRITVTADDFEAPGAWTAGAPGDTATAGVWTRADPNGTVNQGQQFNPEDDASAAGTQCWFTGQGSVGGSVGSQDVDGTTTLTSPVFDLANVETPVISWQQWFASSGSDTLTIDLTNDAGATWTTVDTVGGLRNSWMPQELVVEDWMPRTDSVQLRFTAADDPNNSLCEAAIDDLLIEGTQQALTFTSSGNVAPGNTVTLHLDSPFHPGMPYGIGGSGSVAAGVPVGDRIFPLDIDDLFFAIGSFPTVWVGFLGNLDGSGAADAFFVIPDLPFLSGAVTWYSAVLVGGADIVAITGALRNEIL